MTSARCISLLTSALSVALAGGALACTDATGEAKGGDPLPPVAIPSATPSDAGAGADATDGGDGDAAVDAPRDDADGRVGALPSSTEESSFAFVPRELQKNGVMIGAKND
jgi:hypothetical protein